MPDSRSIGQPSCLLTKQHLKASKLKVAKKEDLIVNTKVLRSSIALAFFVVSLLSGFGSGAPARTSANTNVPPAALSYLPASDAIALIDVRSLDQFVLGVHYTYPSARVTKLETVAIAHGTFDARGLVAAGRIAANGKTREEKYRGATILIFTINDRMKLLGLWDMKINELAVCALDPKSLAIGNVTAVRAAVEAGKKGRANGELASLATRDPNAVIGFGANVPRELLANLNVGNDTVAKDVNSIRQAYGSIGSTAGDVSLMLVARTGWAGSGKN